jgi:hypothetical protein
VDPIGKRLIFREDPRYATVPVLLTIRFQFENIVLPALVEFRTELEGM